jgi:hypothetical protein
LSMLTRVSCGLAALVTMYGAWKRPGGILTTLGIARSLASLNFCYFAFCPPCEKE